MAIDVTVQDASDGIDVTVSGGADTRTNVSDDGSQVVADTTDIDFATNLSVTDDGDQSVTVAGQSDEEIEDIVAALVTGGTNVTATYDDGADTLTIDTSALNEEEVEDAVAALLSAGNAISLTYDDPGDTLTVAVDESALSFYDGTNLTADVDNQSITTEDAVIGSSGQSGSLTADTQPSDYHWELIDTADLSGTPDSVSLDATEYSNEQLLVDYMLRSTGSATDLTMRANGDGAATGNYDFREAGGTDTLGANAITVVDVSAANAYAGGVVRIFDDDAVPIFLFNLAAKTDRTNDQAITGNLERNEDITSVEFYGDTFAATGHVHLYGRSV